MLMCAAFLDRALCSVVRQSQHQRMEAKMKMAYVAVVVGTMLGLGVVSVEAGGNCGTRCKTPTETVCKRVCISDADWQALKRRYPNGTYWRSSRLSCLGGGRLGCHYHSKIRERCGTVCDYKGVTACYRSSVTGGTYRWRL